MGNPANHPRSRECAGERIAGQPKRLQQQCRVELQVGLQRPIGLSLDQDCKRRLLHCLGNDVVNRRWRKVQADWQASCHRSPAAEDDVRLILDGTVVRVRLDGKATSIISGTEMSNER
jgi:hypothetical protein